MAWEHLDLSKPHLAYIILGGFTSLFMLCSSFIKERMYIGEATVATLVGVIFGPHAANLVDPRSWGSSDIVTIEFSRIVLVVQCFAVGVELPKFYMEKHWRSVIWLLVPVMTFGWLVTSVVVFWMIPPFDWLDSLVVAACVTPTDPVLASSVVGKGKFAKRVPKHLRDLLSAESGCNDGMAFPFIYLAIYLIEYKRNAGDVTFHWFAYTILYECLFGAVFGFLVGYIARHAIKYAEKHEMIDRESFLVFYFVIALFCAGSGSMLGLDDLLVGFAAGVGFSNDGWFGEKTEESHVSNVIDLLLNLTYFVYLGTIIPWDQYNSGVEGLYVWRLVVIAIFVVLFRRIPIMLALKPLIPDVRTWREALFAGHFGPIGVGAIFFALLARGELEHGRTVPLATLPSADDPEFNLIYLVWPIVTFLVITSILVHGSSIAVFTLGKRINTLTLTMSYTVAPEEGQSWMNRLPRISSQSRSQAKTEASFDKDFDFSGMPGGFLRRRQDEGSRQGSRASSLVSRRRKPRKDDDAGGPISQSAIFPNREGLLSPTFTTEKSEKDTEYPSQDTSDSPPSSDSLKEKDVELPTRQTEPERAEPERGSEREPRPRKVQVYEEGHDMVFEDDQGEVLGVQPSPRASEEQLPAPVTAPAPAARPWTFTGLRRMVSDVVSTEVEKRKGKEASTRRHEPARAYQFGNTIIVEDQDGEVVKTYEIPSQRSDGPSNAERFNSSLKYVGLGGFARPPQQGDGGEGSSEQAAAAAAIPGWASLLGVLDPARREQQQKVAAEDDKKVRFTIGGVGKRMTKEDFIREVQKLDDGTRKEVVDKSTAPKEIKAIAKKEAPLTPLVPPMIVEQKPSSEAPSVERQPSQSPPKQTASRGHNDGPDETPAERRRRLSVLAHQRDDDETPAERRRREAALGEGDGDGADSDAEEETTARRGIRFAAEPERGRK